MLKFATIFALLAVLIYACAANADVTNRYAEKTISLQPEATAVTAAKIRKEANLEVAEGLALDLWATDSLVNDPIAISVANDGRIFYTRATRQTSSEFDIRGHMDWTKQSMSWQTVEDRRSFLRQNFAAGSEESENHLKDLNRDGIKDWKDLAVEKENVWYVEDRSGDGTADFAARYLVDFGEEITDVANGIEYTEGAVYVAVGPDLWRTEDQNNDGIADRIESLSHGYGVHVGFSGHGMSGAKIGPQGRIWWGIGDIGSNVVDKDGKRWENPNRGVIVRCDPDGSNFEVFAHGVRNTHEFDFDQYGNLITIDNDGDHPGERERLVYLIDGSDTGWRINWQFGKYTDEKNNRYKVWMDEKMYLPRHEGQAAYFLPPIQQYVNGPTGLVYNPGTALGPDWYDHFFVAEFRGSPARSPLHAFRMKADGAGFALDRTQEVVKGTLPTGLDFGPDGALYFGDWINGWGTKNEGRIWRLDVLGADAGATAEVRSKTQTLLTQNFKTKATDELQSLLGHSDRRVRAKAQAALVATDEFSALNVVASDQQAPQLARIHALWGMANLTRNGYEDGGAAFKMLLKDPDAEIIAQAAKLIGDVRYGDAFERLKLLVREHPSPRIRFFAMEALGRTAEPTATEPILDLVRTEGGQDNWLRHGAMVALARIGDEKALAALVSDTSREVRLTAIVALRRMSSPRIQDFLYDADEYVVAEAARGITDDYQIPGAMPALARLLNARPWTNEPLIRRLIVANLNVGENKNVDELLAYAQAPENPAAMRAEALAVLGNWEASSVFDRVDGRFRGVRKHDVTYAKARLDGEIAGLLAKGDGQVRRAAMTTAANLQLTSATDQLAAMLSQERDPQIRAAAVVALDRLRAPGLEGLLRTALADRNDAVRQRALELLPSSTIDPAVAVKLYQDIIAKGTIGEGQAALAGLAQLEGTATRPLLERLLRQMASGDLPAALHLDLEETIAAAEQPTLTAQLEAYEKVLLRQDSLGLWATALAGGDPGPGEGTFYWNASAQCTRCHAIFEYGGNVGPNLAGVASRLSPREILMSIILPSAALAPGHETVLVTLKDEEMLSGIVVERTPEFLEVKTGKTDTRRIAYADIAQEETLPSSMPSAEGKISKREIRDLVAFLAKQHGEESK